MRACSHCSASLVGKRPHAVYCSRSCKTKASDARRAVDGRAAARDRARVEERREYMREYAKGRPFASPSSERRREYARQYARQYLKDNPERMRAIRRRRKGQLRAERLEFTERDWRRLVDRYRGCCAYCGVKPEELHREHVIPLSRGGRHSVGNILPACPPCNYQKHIKLLSEWRYRGKGVMPTSCP